MGSQYGQQTLSAIQFHRSSPSNPVSGLRQQALCLCVFDVSADFTEAAKQDSHSSLIAHLLIETDGLIEAFRRFKLFHFNTVCPK